MYMNINTSIASLCPPLTAAEYSELEASILGPGGCRDALVVWQEQDTLLDGHNRFEICTKHQIAYKTVMMSFANEADAKTWVIHTQLARRNLTPFQRLELAFALEAGWKEQAKRNQLAGTKLDLYQNSGKGLTTDKELAAVAGVSHDTAARSKVIASKATEELKALVRSGECSINQAYTKIRAELCRSRVLEKIAATPLPDQKYRVLYADPPWQYDNQLFDYGEAERHYPTMSLADICALPVEGLTEANAVLFLWATSPMLPEALAVIAAWGFTYKANFCWNKERGVFGHYHAGNHELLLIGVKGSCVPDIKELLPSVVTLRKGKHSEKPKFFRDMIDKLYTAGKRLELFARATAPGWDAWGNQMEMVDTTV